MEPTVYEINLAKDLMQKLFEADFREGISWQPYVNDYAYDGQCRWTYRIGLCDWEADHIELLNELGVDVVRGETKAVVISNDLENWVIKVDIQPTYPDPRRNEGQYCEMEYQHYLAAVDEEVDSYLAAMYKIGELYGITIYLQEMATPDEETMICSFEEYVSFDLDEDDFDEEEDYYYYRSSCARHLEDSEKCYAIFGRDAIDIARFVEENEINDLHEGNWGTTRDGRIVIFDYSGY